MRIALFDPYLDTIGGGERYICTIAEYLSKEHEVNILWNDPTIKEKIENTLSINLKRVNIIPNIFSHFSLIKRLFFLRKYDRLFFLSDGSIPWVSSNLNFLHFQFPVTWVKEQTLINCLKLKRFSSIICNSYFTKRFIDKTFGVESVVVYPPVDIDKFKPEKKEKLIFSVGRFTKSMHSKKQEILIEAFKQFFNKGNKSWKLVLAGGVDKEGEKLLKVLENQIIGYPIEIIPNISFEKLAGLYGRATFFWHGAGFGVDIQKYPEKTEHFGIATVEAMSAGCIPLVVPNGGQAEIVEDNKSGYFFTSVNELAQKTSDLLKDGKNMLKISTQAIERSKFFSKERFCREIKQVIEL